MNGEILSVPLDNITIGARVGFYHPAHAEHIAESYRVHGQIDPIHLRRNGPRADRPWTLVAGLHRLRAAEIVGWQDVKAIQVADKTSDKQTLLRLELSENLDHRSPRPIERAMFITARARIEEAFDFPDMQWMKRESRAAHARWLKQRAIDIALGRPLKGNLPDPEAEDVIAREFGEPNLDAKDIMSSASSRPVELEVLNEDWQARTARAMGCSDRTIRRYIAIHRALVEPYPLDIVEQLNAHPLLESFAGAMRLARVGTARGRRKAVDYLLAHPDCTSVDEALVQLGIATSKGFREPIKAEREAQRIVDNFLKFDVQRRKTTFADLLRAAPIGDLIWMQNMLRERFDK